MLCLLTIDVMALKQPSLPVGAQLVSFPCSSLYGEGVSDGLSVTSQVLGQHHS